MLRVLNLGAGVQSTTLLLMMVLGQIEPARVAIFADTQWEPPQVYRHLEWLEREAEAAGIELRRVTKGSLRVHATTGIPAKTRPGNHFCTLPVFVTTSTGGKGLAPRQCTHDYKIRPIQREIKRLLGLRPRQHWPTTPAVQQVFGISYDEPDRVRRPTEPWTVFEYPLVDRKMTRADCLDWLARHYPGREVPRSACVGCPFHTNAEWRRVKTDPVLWADAVEADRLIRKVGRDRTPSEAFLHRSMVPLEFADLGEGDLETERLASPHGMRNECQGMCGV